MLSRSFKILTVLAPLLVILAACGSRSTSNAMAQVNGHDISKQDYRTLLR